MFRWEQMAYVLHIEPFKETSGLVHFLTPDQGHISAVARGMKRRRRGQATLQPFIAWQIRAQGRGDLLTLTDYQAQRYWPQPRNYAIAVSLGYVHELLVRLLRGNESSAAVFEAYERVLEQLLSREATADLIPWALRPFEKRLLSALGYALPLTQEPELGTAVESHKYYIFDPLRGPRRVPKKTPGAICGDSFWALEQENFKNTQQLHDAKRLTRIALRAQLGEKPLRSPSLWLSHVTGERSVKELNNRHE